MFQTVTVNVSDRLKLEDDPDAPEGGYRIKLIPIVWLPFEIAETFTQWANDNDMLDPEANPTPEQAAQQAERLTLLMQEIVVDWNLTDIHNEVIPVPNKDNPESWKKLPPKVMNLIFEAAGEDDGEIPLQSEAQSSASLRPREPQNREERRALERSSPDGSRLSS